MADKLTTGKDPEEEERVDLRPPGLIRFGLSRAIQVNSDNVRARHPNLRLILDLVDDEQLLPDEEVRVLYGVYVECVHNALLHGKASRVAVRYHPQGSEMALEIEDNGPGFELPADWLAFTRQHKFGLARLRHEVASIGGQFSVETKPGQGTTVIACVPLRSGRKTA